MLRELLPEMDKESMQQLHDLQDQVDNDGA